MLHPEPLCEARPGCQGWTEEESGLTGISSGKQCMVSCQDSHEGSSLNMEMGGRSELPGNK